ncbi:MAG: transketolase [Candidatus Pacebacteria bacterium]|nr:transketolase [Candidatus Paceibacterota bacterium]
MNEHQLALEANSIRESIIEMLLAAGSGHTAGPLGMADIFTALFFAQRQDGATDSEGKLLRGILRHDVSNPFWSERDRLVLSNGHICPIYYATLAHAGYIPKAELLTLRKFGSRLQGHPHREYLDILETSSGPLGSGLSQAAGMAKAIAMDGGRNNSGQPTDQYVFCMMSDGELNEGNSWEAIMFAGKNKLRNLIAIVDRNNIQIDGNTEDIMPLEPLADKWRAFNWHVEEINGHNFEEIIDAVARAKAVFEKPTVIIAHTIPGKGVKEFERDYHWHGKPPSADEAKMALNELRTLGGRIKSEHN